MQSQEREDIFSPNGVQEWMRRAKHVHEVHERASAEVLVSSDEMDKRSSSSGHFTLRSSRIADPLHFIHKLHLQTEDLDPELEELITVIRTTDGLDDFSEKDRTALQSFITATLVKQFEHAKETGELPSPGVATDSHEPMSLKEELADREEEKDGVSMEEDEGDETIADLDFVSAYVARQTQSPLNLDANKQKVQLRQRGSLAKRRKPTRPSVRTASTDDDSSLNNQDLPVLNGHGFDSSPCGTPSSDISTPDRSHDEVETNISMSAATQVSMVGSRTIQGVKTAIVKPEVVESGRQRLRCTQNETLEVRPASVSEEVSPSTPPWLVETRLKKTPRAPKGEAEKLKHETEPETPWWMKDALAKKKRAASKSSGSQSSVDELSVSVITTTRDSTSVSEMSTSSSNVVMSPSSSTTAVPWIQETVQRKSSRTRVTSSTTPKDVENDVNNLIADSIKSEVVSETVNADIPKVIEVSAITKVSKLESSELTNGEGKVLVDNGPSDSTKIISPTRDSSARKSLPPLQQVVSPSSVEQDTPTWRAEVAMRRKNKAYILQQKPETPIKLGEVPQWKIDLVEKKKQRRVSDGTEIIETKLTENTSPGETVLPPWKQEIDQRKKRQSVITRTVFEEADREKEERKPPEEEPEWAQLVALRRQKLANFGLLEDDNADTD